MKMTPEYSTLIFRDLYNDAASFINDMIQFPAIEGFTQDDSDNLTLVWTLLAANYGNSPIANRDINQFTMKLWSTLYQFGPTWLKKTEIQKALRALDIDDLRDGTKAVSNHAFNPSAGPGTGSDAELSYINDQNVSRLKKGKAEAYGDLSGLLSDDLTATFMARFKPLFKQFVMPEDPLLYITEEGED